MARYIDADAFIEDIKTEAMNLFFDGMKGTPRPRKELYDIIDRIQEQPTADVVPKTDLDLLKSTITHKEEEAYNKGYEDAKTDILEKLQAEVERAETIAKYGDDFYEGKAEGVNAAMNCILSEGEE